MPLVFTRASVTTYSWAYKLDAVKHLIKAGSLYETFLGVFLWVDCCNHVRGVVLARTAGDALWQGATHQISSQAGKHSYSSTEWVLNPGQELLCVTLHDAVVTVTDITRRCLAHSAVSQILRSNSHCDANATWQLSHVSVTGVNWVWATACGFFYKTLQVKLMENVEKMTYVKV